MAKNLVGVRKISNDILKAKASSSKLFLNDFEGRLTSSAQFKFLFHFQFQDLFHNLEFKMTVRNFVNTNPKFTLLKHF